MKKGISILLLLSVLFSFNVVYAADISGASGSAVSAPGSDAQGAITLDPDVVYTLGKLQTIALAGSRQALVDDVDIKKKEIAVRTVHSDITSMSDSILSITKPVDVKLELEVAQKTKQDHYNQLKLDVYKTALNIQLCNKEIELQEQKLENTKEKLDIAKARFKSKTITQDDVDSAQYAVEGSQVDLTNCKEKLNTQYLELKKLLNQPLNTSPVRINVDLKQLAFEDVDMDFVLDGLYKTETSVYEASGKLDIAETAMGIAIKLYQKGDLTYDNCTMDLNEATLDLAAAKSTLDANVKNKYNDMVGKLNDITLAGKYCELMTKKLANAQVKYDKGTIGKEALISAKEACLDADYAKLAAIVDYNCVEAELETLIGGNCRAYAAQP